MNRTDVTSGGERPNYYRIALRYAWRLLYPLGLFFLTELVLESGYLLIGTYRLMRRDPLLSQDLEALTKAVTESLTQNSVYVALVRSAILIPVFVFFFLRDNRKNDTGYRESMRYVKPVWYLLLPVVGFTATIGFNFLVDITNLAKYSPTYGQVSNAIYASPVWVTLLMSVVAAPILEELLFRGLIYKRARMTFKPVWSALIASSLFGLVHGNLVQFVYAFLVGLIICWVYELFHNLLAPILFHAGANLIAVMMTYFADTDYSVMIKSIITAVLLLITASIMLLYQFLMKHSKEPETADTL